MVPLSPFGVRRQPTPSAAPSSSAKGKGAGKGARNGKSIEQDDAPPCDNCFVWQLPSEADEHFLEELFAQVGTVVSCKVVPGKRYGFVRLSSVHQATNAIASLNGLDCHGTTIRVKFADSSPDTAGKAVGKAAAVPSPAPSPRVPVHGNSFGNSFENNERIAEPEAIPSDNVYVWQLPAHVDETWLRDLFKQVGNITSVKCVSDKRYGFVRFSTPEEAGFAIEEADGLECNGTIIRVKFADNPIGVGKNMQREPPRIVEPPAVLPFSRGAGAPPMPSAAADQRTRIFVQDRRPSAASAQRTRIFVQDLPIELSKDAVAHMLERYCPGIHCEFLYRDSLDQVAMISVPTTDDARWLAETLHGNIPDGMAKPIRIAVSWPVSAPPSRVPVSAPSYSRAPAHPPDRAVPYHKPGGSRRGDSDGHDPPNDNVYVNNLPQGFDEARLEQLFMGCGRIASLKCFAEKRYGFVRFASPEEASQAIDTVNGIDIDGSVVVCKFAQKKSHGA